MAQRTLRADALVDAVKVQTLEHRDTHRHHVPRVHGRGAVRGLERARSKRGASEV